MEEVIVKVLLCYNVVEIFDEVNIGKNIGSGVLWVIWDIIFDNDDVEIEVYMVGGGCMLFGCLKVLMLLEGYEGVVKFVFENIFIFVVNVCLLVLVGVGIVILVEIVVVFLCKVILCLIGSCYFNLKAVELELCLEEGFNCLGIGL